ncbi:unnamed protein product [Protopolystoma xenopodis]|uniref:Uncharacterized protein n=1 Tax=Protopolystoma xenopodis TaxID=117903 RepID=A0A448X2R8_9PLAT|nr:unnamed protein product [Protopolystoma xenopodis]
MDAWQAINEPTREKVTVINQRTVDWLRHLVPELKKHIGNIQALLTMVHRNEEKLTTFFDLLSILDVTRE